MVNTTPISSSNLITLQLYSINTREKSLSLFLVIFVNVCSSSRPWFNKSKLPWSESSQGRAYASGPLKYKRLSLVKDPRGNRIDWKAIITDPAMQAKIRE